MLSIPPFRPHIDVLRRTHVDLRRIDVAGPVIGHNAEMKAKSIVNSPPITATGRRKSGRPALFTHEHIVNTAIRLVERDGRRGLTVRAIAQELDTAPASIYNYFDNLASLEDAVAAALLLRIKKPKAGKRRLLREQIVAATIEYRDTLLHLDWAEMAGPLSAKVSADYLESWLESVAAFGVDLDRAGIAFETLNALANHHAVIIQRRSFHSGKAVVTPLTGRFTKQMFEMPFLRGTTDRRFRNVVIRVLDLFLPELNSPDVKGEN
jgi:AcrR family transcriptional regulator